MICGLRRWSTLGRGLTAASFSSGYVVGTYTESRVRKLTSGPPGCQVGDRADWVRGVRSMTDVVVLGAGLAGLSAARDLTRGGADVLVLEARSRVGGRVEATTLPDGRTVQLGGEVVGHGHTAYLELVDELGLSVQPSYVADPGEMSWGLEEGVFIGDDAPWMS